MGNPVVRSALILEAFESRVHLSAGTAGFVHATATLSQEGSPPAATTVRNLALVAGGPGVGGVVDKVDIFNAATGRWSAVGVRGVGQSKAAATVGDRAIFVAKNKAFVYTARTGRWSAAPIAPLLTDVVAASVGDAALFAEGVTDANGNGGAVDLYNARTGQWSTAKLSQPRDRMSVAVVGGKVLIAGGSINSGGRTVGSNVLDIYDAATGLWSTATLSSGRFDMAATTVDNKAIFAGGGSSAADNVVDIYNADTGQWSTATLSQSRAGIAATTVGDLAIFAGGGNPLATAVVDTYNGVTNQWSTATLPQPLAFASAVTVGSRAIFAGGNGAFGPFPMPGPSDAVDIFDAVTGRWSSATLSQARDSVAAVEVGSTAIFAGGNFAFPAFRPSSVVDFFTLPSLGGSLALAHRGHVLLTLTNTGASALPAPDSVAVYASTGRALDSSAVLLGSIRVRDPLAAGASEQLTVPILIPTGLAPGRYHLIAAAGPPHQLTQFASQRRTFTVGPAATGAPTTAAIPVFLAQSVVFTTGAAIGDSIFNDSKDQLDGTAQR